MKNLLIYVPNRSIFLCLDDGLLKQHSYYEYNLNDSSFSGLRINGVTFGEVEADITTTAHTYGKGLTYIYTSASTPDEALRLHPEFFL